MKEKKFRAWNKKTNIMMDLKKITPLALDPKLADEIDGVFIPFNKDIIVQQYVGLKDKNGKEIFEGDIINQNWTYGPNPSKEFIGEVKMIARGVCLYNRYKRYFQVRGCRCEVIGHIYEPPKEQEHIIDFKVY